MLWNLRQAQRVAESRMGEKREMVGRAVPLSFRLGPAPGPSPNGGAGEEGRRARLARGRKHGQQEGGWEGKMEKNAETESAEISTPNAVTFPFSDKQLTCQCIGSTSRPISN